MIETVGNMWRPRGSREYDTFNGDFIVGRLEHIGDNQQVIWYRYKDGKFVAKYHTLEEAKK